MIALSIPEQEPSFGFLKDMYKAFFLYLHISQQFRETLRSHNNGGVQFNDIAFVEGDVMIGCQPLKPKQTGINAGRKLQG